MKEIFKQFQLHKSCHDIYPFVLKEKVNKCKSKSIQEALRTPEDLRHLLGKLPRSKKGREMSERQARG